MSLCKLTVRFEDPFWVGLVEVQDGGDYSVAKHVFGAEPSTPEVYDFFLAHWNNLRFTREIQVEAPESKRINPKRLRRMIEKELRSDTRHDTKAQQALSEERSLAKETGAQLSRQRKQEREREQFAKRTEKRKQKHRGR